MQQQMLFQRPLCYMIGIIAFVHKTERATECEAEQATVTVCLDIHCFWFVGPPLQNQHALVGVCVTQAI